MLPTFGFGVEDGGEGFVEYSVRDRELTLRLGVLGRLSTTFSLMLLTLL